MDQLSHPPPPPSFPPSPLFIIANHPVGVYFSMYLLNAWPRNTFVPILLGSVVEAVGVGVLAWALWHEHLPSVYGTMALTGAGTGILLMPASLHAVGFFPQQVASVVALMAVALPFGGTLALTVMSAVFNNTSGILGSSPLRSLTTLVELPPAALAAVAAKAKVRERRAAGLRRNTMQGMARGIRVVASHSPIQ